VDVATPYGKLALPVAAAALPHTCTHSTKSGVKTKLGIHEKQYYDKVNSNI